MDPLALAEIGQHGASSKADLVRVRDPRVPAAASPRPPEVGVIRALIGPGPPGRLNGMTFAEVRVELGGAALGANDGLIHQALLDEGLEVTR